MKSNSTIVRSDVISDTKSELKSGLKPDQGSTTLEFTLIYGLLLGLILTIVHFGLLYYASLAVADAADASLEALQSNVSASAEAVVEELVGDDPLLKNLETSVEVKEDLVNVAVSANSPALIPGLPNYISRQATGSLERFIPESER